LLETRSGRVASQNEFELRGFIELLRARRVSRYLEIGARHGDTFFEVMRALPRGAKGIAVDLPGGMWGTRKSRDHLEAACVELRHMGYDAHCLFGDSNSVGIRQLVMLDGPYEAALIDGDHRYEGVKADWENYARMAPIIAFHDIVGEGQAEKVHGNPVEVPRLWAELKAEHDHVEFVDAGSKMGIGCIFRA
jgi:hypothetical protein